MNYMETIVSGVYRPLNGQEIELIHLRREEFYKKSRAITTDEEAVRRRIRNLRREYEKGGYENKDLVKRITEQKAFLVTLSNLLDISRPQTPEGILICHNCDIRGMAITRYEQPPEATIYRCQSCNAEDIVDLISDSVRIHPW